MEGHKGKVKEKRREKKRKAKNNVFVGGRIPSNAFLVQNYFGQHL